MTHEAKSTIMTQPHKGELSTKTCVPRNKRNSRISEKGRRPAWGKQISRNETEVAPAGQFAVVAYQEERVTEQVASLDEVLTVGRPHGVTRPPVHIFTESVNGNKRVSSLPVWFFDLCVEFTQVGLDYVTPTV
jgi:hypothetical protein